MWTDSEKNKIVLSLLRLGAFLVRTGNRLIADFGINQQQFAVLARIQYKEPISQKDICSQLLHEKSNVSKIVKKLEKLDPIEKMYSEDDARLNLLRVTNKGKNVIETCMSLFDKWNNEWLQSLSRKEVKQVVEILDKLKMLK